MTMPLLLAPAALQAGRGVMPYHSTLRIMTMGSHAFVKARLGGVMDRPAPEENAEVALYRHNNPNPLVRRDARLIVSEVLRNSSGQTIGTGDLNVVSLQQRVFAQYPASLQQGEEGLFALEYRESDGLWRIVGEYRGVITAEESPDGLTPIEDEARWIIGLYNQHEATYGNEPVALFASLQDHMMGLVTLDGSRLSVDVLYEFSSHHNNYDAHFTGAEKAQLLSLLPLTSAGGIERQRMLHTFGFVKPEGGQQPIVDVIASDASTSTAAVGSWTLEKYGRASSLDMLLDKYAEKETEAGYWEGEEEYYEGTPPTVSCARLIQAMRLISPQSFMPGEAAPRTLFLSILRRTLSPTSDPEILKESLLAARNLRCSDGELDTELKALVNDFHSGLVDESVYKRVIVAFAAARTNEANAYITGLKGDFQKRFDKHIDMCLTLNPFTILVDGQ